MCSSERPAKKDINPAASPLPLKNSLACPISDCFEARKSAARASAWLELAGLEELAWMSFFATMLRPLFMIGEVGDAGLAGDAGALFLCRLVLFLVSLRSSETFCCNDSSFGGC